MWHSDERSRFEGKQVLCPYFPGNKIKTQVKCSEIFTPVITDNGVCCAFNLHMNFKDSDYSQLVREMQVLEFIKAKYTSIHKQNRDWHLLVIYGGFQLTGGE